MPKFGKKFMKKISIEAFSYLKDIKHKAKKKKFLPFIKEEIQVYLS